MKKIVGCILLSVCLCFTLVGCNMEGGTQTTNEGSTPKIYNRDIYEFIDPDTGVHYWIYSRHEGYGGMGGMTPRLNSDGTIMVTKMKGEDHE